MSQLVDCHSENNFLVVSVLHIDHVNIVDSLAIVNIVHNFNNKLTLLFRGCVTGCATRKRGHDYLENFMQIMCNKTHINVRKSAL
jgi:hypothetical protein